ncbi:hypothetical protein DUNSADRAFT_10334 [Dunaliella salina]|uniref:Mediator of RNA polymerase II transcription subunit 28 n=1 Tax=Dunaliella salina TaxID=3046 RepID=A0ABQ7H4W2_DUNSA|nr:hypothetical protein DUNSADRAFT_10334 [Dunaliella salina]|eukprot:KAF5841897.1 hypothetical protein DUNSADRAFT_10334 [Dunaliella salina]
MATGLDDALQLVDQLDSALGHMLPPPQPEQGATHHDDEDAVEQSQEASRTFVQAIKALHATLQSVQRLQPANERDALAQDIHALQVELEKKEKLLQHSSQKVEEWQKACDELKSLHHATLFNFSS